MKIDDDISSSLDLVLLNIPEDVPQLYQVRWLYMKLGELFCYDYRVMIDPKIVNKKVDFHGKISKYQTCSQISAILAFAINSGIIEGVKAKVVNRNIPNKRTRAAHEAVLLTVNEKENYLLDLTLDLYRIQSKMQTKNFGFNSLVDYDCDIISLRECEEMDKKLEIYSEEGYFDKRIELTKEYFDNLSKKYYGRSLLLEVKLDFVKNELLKNFDGDCEAKRYVDDLLLRVLSEEEKQHLSMYNLSYGEINDLGLISCYMFEGDNPLCYIFKNKLGLIKTSPERINSMLEKNWRTNSNELKEKLKVMTMKRENK